MIKLLFSSFLLLFECFVFISFPAHFLFFIVYLNYYFSLPTNDYVCLAEKIKTYFSQNGCYKCFLGGADGILEKGVIFVVVCWGQLMFLEYLCMYKLSPKYFQSSYHSFFQFGVDYIVAAEICITSKSNCKEKTLKS